MFGGQNTQWHFHAAVIQTTPFFPPKCFCGRGQSRDENLKFRTVIEKTRLNANHSKWPHLLSMAPQIFIHGRVELPILHDHVYLFYRPFTFT